VGETILHCIHFELYQAEKRKNKKKTARNHNDFKLLTWRRRRDLNYGEKENPNYSGEI